MGLTDVRANNPGSSAGMTLPLNAYPIGAGAQIPTITPIIACPANSIGNLPGLKTAARKAEAQKLAYELMGALSHLEQYRADFLNNADYIDLFPAMYADTTAADMSRIANGDYQYPSSTCSKCSTFTTPTSTIAPIGTRITPPSHSGPPSSSRRKMPAKRELYPASPS
jgi:hypothetical protein